MFRPLRFTTYPKVVLWTLTLGALSSVPRIAAQIAPASSPRSVVIRAGRVLDVKTGNTLTNQVIVIEGDKIVSVGPAAEAKRCPMHPIPSRFAPVTHLEGGQPCFSSNV